MPVGILRIGVVGYSGQRFNEHDADHMLVEAFNTILLDHPGADEIWVVSGLTNLGIPGLAYRAANARGWRTSGIACAKAEQYDCYNVDERMIVGDNWGDESETFLAEIDVIVRVGGGTQSHAETKAFAANGGRTYEYELAAISG